MYIQSDKNGECYIFINLNMSSPVTNAELEVMVMEAQGNLNRQIQKALQEFRTTLTDKVFKGFAQKQKEDQYSISKQGPQKSFKFRQSLLTIMFNIKDFKTIYNMAVASFAILTFTLIYDNYTSYGQFIDLKTFGKIFENWTVLFSCWWLLALLLYLIIIVTKISLHLPKQIWIPLYFAHISTMFMLCTYILRNFQMGFACAVIILAQTVRMVMKAHSYFRTKMLYCTNNPYKQFQLGGIKINDYSNQKSLKLDINMKDLFTELKRFSYFFICPTLIYRDSYTLTPVRKLSNILLHTTNFLFCVYYAFILYIVSCQKPIQNLRNKMDVPTFLMTIIKLMMPSVCFLILGFFGFLHSWLNLWSQLTRFPDRAFYSDWWNSVQFGSYYRKWNITVHDWLYYYIYLDIRRFFPILQKKFKAIPQLMTFLISAVIHQYIIWQAIGFFYPILFILFTGPGILLIRNQNKLKAISINLLFWLELYIGTAMLFSFYLMQHFARQIIPDIKIEAQWGYLSFLIPRTIYLGSQSVQ